MSSIVSGWSLRMFTRRSSASGVWRSRSIHTVCFASSAARISDGVVVETSLSPWRIRASTALDTSGGKQVRAAATDLTDDLLEDLRQRVGVLALADHRPAGSDRAG